MRVCPSVSFPGDCEVGRAGTNILFAYGETRLRDNRKWSKVTLKSASDLGLEPKCWGQLLSTELPGTKFLMIMI